MIQCLSGSPQLASRTAISSCTLCKKHFRTSQIFVEHLQSQEHRQKVEKVCVCVYTFDLEPLNNKQVFLINKDEIKYLPAPGRGRF